MAPGFAGPLWVSADPAVGDVLVREYRCFEVVAECIHHDDRDRTCIVALTSTDYPHWYDAAEVEWSTTWNRMEWIVQQSLGLPPHRTAVFDAGRSLARAADQRGERSRISRRR